MPDANKPTVTSSTQFHLSDPWDEPTVVRFDKTPRCPDRSGEPVELRDGFVAAREAVAA